MPIASMIGTKRPSHQRFPGRAARGAAALAVVLLAACGGGGGGAPAVLGPVIVAAAFVGPSVPPQPGNRLWLFLSKDVQLDASGAVSDADFTFSGNGSLGAVTAAPTLLSSRSIEITLGVGVDLMPGTTTVSWSATSDVVRDVFGKPGEPSTPIVIGWSDGTPPTLSNVTVAAIDGELNGTGPAGGTLQVPVNGWALELAWADDVAVERAVITADVAISTASGALLPGADLAPHLVLTNPTAAGGSYAVPSSVVFPETTVTLTCAAVDTSGLASAPRAFAVRAKTFAARLRPFETDVNPGQVWYLDFGRDVEALTPVVNGGAANVMVTAGSNGLPDFDEVLRAIGLNSASPLPNVIGGQNSNQVAQDLFKQALLAQLAAFYTGANVSFTLSQPAGTFASPTVPYSGFGYSQIAIAGSSSQQGVLGVAIFDPHNDTQDDDTITDFFGMRLGIFLHTIADVGLSSSASTSFRLTFDPLAPIVGGTPIGGDPQDGQRLLGTLADARAAVIDTALADFARFTAVVLAHECGHSMGLVENGPMPLGLYGNDPVNFPGSLDGHIRNTSLFPSGATNIMSPSLSYGSTLHAATAFNSLNMAYLREQVFYGN